MRISDWSSDVCSSDLGNAFGQIAALDFDLADFGARKGRTDFFLDEFSCGFTDKHAVVAADVVDDGFVELVATNTHRTLEIGRASCRERVGQYGVDLGGRRSIKKKKN